MAIDGDPNDYDFGLNFNYNVWNADTTLTLVNVPWDAEYQDTVKFADRGALNAYIDAQSTAYSRIGNSSYAKVDQPVRIGMPFNRAMQYNYLRASNPAQPIPGGDVPRDWYYFIVDVRYINPGTTELVVQLDVFQSFEQYVSYGSTFVERGHIGVANENNFDNYGRDYLTEPEGFDIGAGYRLIAKRDEFIAGLIDMGAPAGQIQRGYSILAISTVDLKGDAGTETDPKKPVASGSTALGLPSGADVYIWRDAGDFQQFLSEFKDLPWMTDGIVSLTIIPQVSRYNDQADNLTPDPVTHTIDVGLGLIEPLRHQLFAGWRDAGEIINNIDPRYRHFKKFLTFPYMLIEATTFTDTPLVLKPEEWADDDATMMERASFMPPNQRVSFNPLHYNSAENAGEDPWSRDTTGITDGGDDYGEYLDMTTQISSFPKTAIVNNGAINYLAATTHARNAARDNATWAQVRANSTAAATAANEERGRRAAEESTVRQNAFQRQQAARDAEQAGQSRNIDLTTGGFLNPVGSFSAAAQGIHTANAQRDNTAAATALASQQTMINSRAGQEMTDRNRDLAASNARGDYAQAIGALQAQVQDAEMVAPSVSGQFGGESHLLVNNAMKLSLRFKLIDNAAIRRIGEYWNRYGYAVNQHASLPDSLMVMDNYTYWKTTGARIIAAGMPELYKNTIRGILDKGVTVWGDPDRIGNYGTNNPLPGVSI